MRAAVVDGAPHHGIRFISDRLAIRKSDPEATLLAGLDLSSLQTLFLAGERLDPDTYAWASEKLGVPVVDHWWQTETGWPITANPRGLEPMPIKPGSSTVPMPGFDIEILDGAGNRLTAGEEGAIAHPAAAAARHPADRLG